jgi:hypothetical protein
VLAILHALEISTKWKDLSAVFHHKQAGSSMSGKNIDSSEHSHRPKLLTQAGHRFFDFDTEIAAFLMFFVRWTQRPDQMYEDLVKIVYDSEPDVLKSLLAEPKQGLANVKRFARFVMEMILVRGTDNFLTYISELLALVFTGRPETLKSGETVKLEEILQYSTMPDLVHHLAERRVERLSYQGMRDLQKDLAERLNIEIFLSDESLSRAVRIIETRNLVVHNRGILNRTFQTKANDFSGGLRLTVDVISAFRRR